jgi:hypothetical protein
MSKDVDTGTWGRITSPTSGDNVAPPERVSGGQYAR